MKKIWRQNIETFECTYHVKCNYFKILIIFNLLNKVFKFVSITNLKINKHFETYFSKGNNVNMGYMGHVLIELRRLITFKLIVW